MLQNEDTENSPSNEHNPLVIANENNNAANVRSYSVVSQHEETVLVPKVEQWQRTSDESFEVIEKMCNKTASDPNSTLFQYLHSDHKEEIVESAKKRSRSVEKDEPYKEAYDAEAKALKRLLDELRLEEQIQLENESPLKGVDLTSLEDVEAPSKFWENTFTSETHLQTSPVKMVGLLRPSTIIEDYDGEDVSLSLNISSHNSFQSASKGAFSEVSSGCYETAHDSTADSKTTQAAGSALIDIEVNQEDQYKESTSDSPLPNIVITNATLNNISTEVNFGDESKKSVVMEELCDLIDLEKTLGPSQKSPHSSVLGDGSATKLGDEAMVNDVSENTPTERKEMESSESEDSVIEILSDDDIGGHDEDLVKTTPRIKAENVSVTEYGLEIGTDKVKDPSSMESNYSTPANEKDFSREIDANKENCLDFDKSTDTSLNFNDTIEEVEYMMKKGLEYLAAQSSSASSQVSAKPKTLEAKPSPLKLKQNTFDSVKSAERYRSPSPLLHKQKPICTTSIGKSKLVNTTPRSAEKEIAKPKPLKPYLLEMKPFPKLDLFKKPTKTAVPISSSMRQKDANSKHFSHIVSPIRAYIQRGTNTPLMTTIKDVNKNPDSLTSMRQLERESRLYKPNFDGPATNTAIASLGPSSLPKKAYISSEFKHIIDERTPVKIPGGKQYQKHIEMAMLPAVLKHEGKMKIPGFPDSSCPGDTSKPVSSSHIPRRTDASAADLPMISGDISMYTIKDARKF